MSNNKLKLSIIAIATMLASNTNAQTFYQCMPKSCNEGEYFDGAKCKKITCPAGTYYSNGSCARCQDFYWSNAGASSCGKMKSSVLPNLDRFCASLPCYGSDVSINSSEDYNFFTFFVTSNGVVFKKSYITMYEENCSTGSDDSDSCTTSRYMDVDTETFENGVTW